MKLKNSHPRFHRRALPVAAAFLALLFAGTGAALADRDGHHKHGKHRYKGKSCDSGKHHRYDDRHHRYDRHHRDDYRYDRHRDRYRYDRHRDRYRYERNRYDRYDRRYDRHRYHHRHDRYRHNHRRFFDIPRVIAHDLLHHYKPYYYGRVYHREHGHYHDIYRFPVYTEYGVEYYPYAYCEGKFYSRGIFRNGRPVFEVRIRF